MSASVPNVVLINGVPAREVSALDRGLHFGDGLFETISCRAGRPRFLRLHLERLSEGCRRLQLNVEDASSLGEQVARLAAQRDAAIVKLIVTRGDALVRGYAATGNERATQVLLRYDWPSQSVPSALRVGVASQRLGENPALAGLKHLNRLEQVLAQRERQERGVDELLLLSSAGSLISGRDGQRLPGEGRRFAHPHAWTGAASPES